MGAKGCALGTIAGIQYFPAVDFPKPVLDTNGAGNSLAVGFLSARIFENIPLNLAILHGQIAARHTCTLKADSDHLISQSELKKYAEHFNRNTDE